MNVNKAAYANALRAVNQAEAKKIDELPDKKWRRAYSKHLVEQVRHSAQSPENALAVAHAGLDYLHNTMVFVRPDDGKEVSINEAMKTYKEPKFITHEIQGSESRASKYTVQYKPYGTPGPLKELSGDALHKQIDTWVKNGAIETSCGASMSKVANNPDWCDLSDTYFVLFGATSAMGPFFKLMDHGANVIALDLDRPQIWEKLIKDTRERAGKLIFPVKEKIPAGASDADIAKVAGCNLLTDTPEIRTWLKDLFPEKRLVCMALAYLDGALFVKVSVAMDAIIKSLIEERGAEKVMPAYLCTPTDAHLCTPASVEAAKANMRRAPGWQGMLAPILSNAGIPMIPPMKKNVERPILDADGNPMDGLHVVDCIVGEQGPNYILAKRLQHWRAMVSRDAGSTVSSNVAPSTATASVLSNVLFALGYKGMSMFKPMEITYQETSNAVMASLLIRDIRDPSAAANPKTPLKNPLCLFTDNAFHGGCWRSAWKFSGVGAPALLGYAFTAFIVAPYLFLYSSYQCLGWGRALIAILTSTDKAAIWGQVGADLSFFQHLGMMEVLHSVVGATRSSPFLTFIQIFSRFMVVAMLNGCGTELKFAQTSDGWSPYWVTMMLTAWCFADFSRYVFYCFGLARDIAGSIKGLLVAMKMIKVKAVVKADDPVFKIPFPLVWIRYSLFIVLYPSGVLGELMVIWQTRAGMFKPLMGAAPDTMSGFTLQSLKFLCRSMGLLESTWRYYGAILFVYAVGLPILYLTLLGARKKQLAPPPKADKAKKTQ